MSLKHTHILYWSLLVGCFILILLAISAVSHSDGSSNEQQKPIDVTTTVDVMAGRYYQTSGQYHVDMNGVSSMVLSVKDLPDNMHDYHFLVINKFGGFRGSTIYLTAQLTDSQNETSAFKQKLIKNQQSINHLNTDWQRAEHISDVAIVIEPNSYLGFVKSFDNEVSWQSIQFTSNKQIKPLEQLWSELSAFVPLSFSSLNFHNSEVIGLYKSMLISLAIWLILSVGLFYMLKPATSHLFISIALAWLMAAITYGHNFSKQSQFNFYRFAEHSPHLNPFDQRLADMAQHINEGIAKNDSDNVAKIIILGSNDFDKKRLTFHLLHHNVGIVGDYSKAINSLNQTNTYVLLLPPFDKFCKPESYDVQLKASDILIKSNHFCLIQ